MTPNSKQYLEAIEKEIEKLEDGKFTGNIDFRINWKDGIIGNVNCGLNKSFKFPRKDN
ncbi:hypothetical protein LCGC14_2504570 [marine sediment metagenome]|uniref:Uncharacterized protein n=1 Tax=marine sediment metagenome TaxID=412755 RepID=A0A0F9BNX5_9ZZZZ